MGATITRYIYDGEDILLEYDGAIVKSYVYDSYGQILIESGTLANPYTYTAREFDGESGLHFYRARYYDPRTGKFTQEDPIGFAGEDPNLYAYVFSNPMNFTDPSGEYIGLIQTAIHLFNRAAAAVSRAFRGALRFFRRVRPDTVNPGGEVVGTCPIPGATPIPGKPSQFEIEQNNPDPGPAMNRAFEKLVDPDTIIDVEEGIRSGQMADGSGRKVIMRNRSLDGCPIIEIQRITPFGRTRSQKVRFGNPPGWPPLRR